MSAARNCQRLTLRSPDALLMKFLLLTYINWKINIVVLAFPANIAESKSNRSASYHQDSCAPNDLFTQFNRCH